MNSSLKITVIILIGVLTVGYSEYQISQQSYLHDHTENHIIEQMPSWQGIEVDSGRTVSSESLMQNSSKGVVIHFWGTWCAPCEAELPSFIKLAVKFQDKGVKFILLAVSDTKKSVKKFIKKHKIVLPRNASVVLDTKGESMPIFGTSKVPETYLFGSGLSLLAKYTGPQTWQEQRYFDEISTYLGIKSN